MVACVRRATHYPLLELGAESHAVGGAADQGAADGLPIGSLEHAHRMLAAERRRRGTPAAGRPCRPVPGEDAQRPRRSDGPVALRQSALPELDRARQITFPSPTYRRRGAVAPPENT